MRECNTEKLLEGLLTCQRRDFIPVLLHSALKQPKFYVKFFNSLTSGSVQK